MATDGCFELEIFADVKGQAEAPQPLRSGLLGAKVVTVADTCALDALLHSLPAAEPRIVHAHFDLTRGPRQ
jgi:hypothetical protein